MFLEEKIINELQVKQTLMMPSCGFINSVFFRSKEINNKLRKNTGVSQKKTMIAGITITEKCNLNCIYCYEKYKTDKTITLQTSKQIITRILTAKSIWTDVEFRILGGEPFVESALLREIVDWTLNHRWGKGYQFRVSTNGTLLDKQLKKWLVKNRTKIVLILSMDGSSDIHNKNRNYSYEKIDFDFFKKNWPEQSIKMTVNKKSLSNLYNSVIHIMDRGFNASFNLAGGEEWNNDDLQLFCIELKKLEKLFSNPAIKIPPIFDINFIRVLNQNDSTRQCGIGKSVVVYDTEGKSYPCHLFLPNTLNMNYEEIPKINFFSNDNILKDEVCNMCVIKNICPTCYAYNFVERGNCNTRDYRLCNFIKEIIKSAVIIKTQRLIQTKTNSVSREVVEEIDACLFLDRYLD